MKSYKKNEYDILGIFMIFETKMESYNRELLSEFKVINEIFVRLNTYFPISSYVNKLYCPE